MTIDLLDFILVACFELYNVLILEEHLQILGVLDYGLAKVADLVIKYVIIPAVDYNSPITLVEELKQGSEEMTEAALKIVQSVDPMVIT